MTLFMTELAVGDFAASLAWYRDTLGLPVTHLDEAKRFALLGNDHGRLALKGGEPRPDGVTLHFEVADLASTIARLATAGVVTATDPKDSPEGYREVFVADPDGHRVGLFEWTGRPS